MPNKLVTSYPLPTTPNGFTLLEIITAMLIIAIMFAAAFPNLRKFNQGQDLDTNTSTLVQAIKLTQSNAMSNISCGVNPAKDWRIRLYQNRFQISASCMDLTNGNTLTPITLPEQLFKPNNIISTNECIAEQGGQSMDIIFKGSTVQFICPSINGSDFTIPSAAVDLVLTDNNISDCWPDASGQTNCAAIKVTKAGIITRL